MFKIKTKFWTIFMSIIKGMIYTTLLGNLCELEGNWLHTLTKKTPWHCDLTLLIVIAKLSKLVVRKALVLFVCRFHLVWYAAILMYYTFTHFKCQKVSIFAATVYFWTNQLTKWVKPCTSHVANKSPDTRLVCYYLCNFLSYESIHTHNEWKDILGCWRQPSLNSVPAWFRYFPALRRPWQMPCYSLHNHQK